MSRTRFALLNCEDAPKWAGYEQMWFAPLRGAGEHWSAFDVCGGELPARVEDYDGYVIPGSHHSCRDESLTWLPGLLDFVRDCHASSLGSDVRVFASCFGCQVAALALGGRVDANPSRRFEFGVESIRIEATFYEQCFAPADGWPGDLKMIESHGECVVDLPPGARRLASSRSCHNEMFAVGDRLLAMQCHPELVAADAMRIIFPALMESSRLSATQAERAVASMDEALGSAWLMGVVERFLKAPAIQKKGAA